MTTPLKVLQIEDDPLDARLLKDMLAKETQPKIELTQVEYLRDATQCVRDRHFDVALLDLMLPDEKGINSILTLRANAPQLPIVVYTSLPGLTMAREAIMAGAEDYAVKGHTDSFTLVHKLVTAIDRHKLKRELYGKLATLNSENQALEDLSYHDPLTGLYNRRGLDARLSIYLQPETSNSYATLIDVDDFKRINDHYGHHIGDQVLQEVAQSMVACSQGRTVLARIGGDEFLVVGMGEKDAAVAEGHKLRAALLSNLALQHLSPDLKLTVCQSILILDRRKFDLSQLLESAHAGLAHAKITGKDKVIGQWALKSGEPSAPV